MLYVKPSHNPEKNINYLNPSIITYYVRLNIIGLANRQHILFVGILLELSIQEYPQLGYTKLLVRLVIYPSLSLQRVFDSFAKRDHFINFLSEVRCSMIGYLQVQYRIWHSDDRTTFTIKTLISFEYLCSYNLIPIQHTYILTNT